MVGPRGGCRALGLALVMAGTAVSTASAQGRAWVDRAFLNLNFAQQTTERRTVTSGSFPVNGQTATFESRVSVDAEAMFDVMGGIRVWRNLALGLGYASYGDPSTAVVSGTIPDPAAGVAPHPFDTALPDQEHREGAVHLSATWMVPFGNNIDIAVFAGPSFISLSKDLVTGFRVEPGTANLQEVTTQNLSDTGVGGHFGVDIRYTVLDDLSGIRKIGFGLFLRYSGASVDADVEGGRIELGGYNYGIGLRLGF